jgi:uncharacterized protein (DUF1778 family)
MTTTNHGNTGNKNASKGREEWPRLNIDIEPTLKSACVKSANAEGKNLSNFVADWLAKHPKVAELLKKNSRS